MKDIEQTEQQEIDPAYPLTTSFMIILHRGDDFLFKNERGRLCAFYYKPEKINPIIRQAACRCLLDDHIETSANKLKLYGVTDTPEGQTEEHMFVYICPDFRIEESKTSDTEFVWSPLPSPVLTDERTRGILISIKENKPLPQLNNRFRVR